MGVKQYIGARYVPIFGRKDEDSILWDNTGTYEPLTVVLYEGNSYTSRQYVPIGIDIENEDYWALTGNYNAQIEQYRLETEQAVENSENALNQVDDLSEIIGDEFSSENTVADSIDNIAAEITTISNTLGNSFSTTNTVSEAISTISETLDNEIESVTGDIESVSDDVDALETTVANLATTVAENAVDAFYTGFSFTYVDATNGNDSTGDGTSENPYKTLQYAIEHLIGIGNRDLRIYLKAGIYTINARAITGVAIHLDAIDPSVTIVFDTGSTASATAAAFSFYNCHLNFEGYSSTYKLKLATNANGNLVLESSNAIFKNVEITEYLYLRATKCSLTDVTTLGINAGASAITIRNTLTLTDSSGTVCPLMLQDGSSFHDDGGAHVIYPTLSNDASVAAIVCRGSAINLIHQIPYLTETPANKWLYTADLNVGSTMSCPTAAVYNYMNNTTIQMSTNGLRIRNGSRVFIGNYVYSDTISS